MKRLLRRLKKLEAAAADEATMSDDDAAAISRWAWLFASAMTPGNETTGTASSEPAPELVASVRESFELRAPNGKRWRKWTAADMIRWCAGDAA